MLIPAGKVNLEGELEIPANAKGVVIFVHGSGSSRKSPRNQYVARELQKGGIGTLLFDLLTAQEDEIYENRFDIDLLTERLETVTSWLLHRPEAKGLGIGYFGASTGAAAAICAAVDLGSSIQAVVSRGGRPDLAGDKLKKLRAPALLIVGGADDVVIELNREAYERIPGEKKVEIVAGAAHLFEEPGALETVANLAFHWFQSRLSSKAPAKQ